MKTAGRVHNSRSTSNARYRNRQDGFIIPQKYYDGIRDALKHAGL